MTSAAGVHPTLHTPTLDRHFRSFTRPVPNLAAIMADSESIHMGQVYSNDDDLRLAAFGKKQQMKRHFNIWSLLFMSFCTSVTWEALTSTMTQALLAGGSSSMIWGFLASALGALCIALSISEFASIIPTAGGQYDYTTELSPPRFRRIFSWFSGWITIWGWITSSASGIFATSMQIQAYIILFRPGYVYERWHTTLVCKPSLCQAIVGTWLITSSRFSSDLQRSLLLSAYLVSNGFRN